MPTVGLVAKNPAATRTVISHVNCGSRKGYTSQYISFTTSLDVTAKYSAKSGGQVVEVDTSNLPSGCQIFDLTVQANHDMYLGNAVCANFAKSDCEVLLLCTAPVPCTVIMQDEDELPGSDGNQVQSYMVTIIWCFLFCLIF